MRRRVIKGIKSDLSVVEDMIRFRGRVCVLSIVGLRDKILVKTYSSFYTVYLRSVKMYQDLKKSLWWTGMKRNMA